MIISKFSHPISLLLFARWPSLRIGQSAESFCVTSNSEMILRWNWFPTAWQLHTISCRWQIKRFFHVFFFQFLFVRWENSKFWKIFFFSMAIALEIKRDTTYHKVNLFHFYFSTCFSSLNLILETLFRSFTRQQFIFKSNVSENVIANIIFNLLYFLWIFLLRCS